MKILCFFITMQKQKNDAIFKGKEITVKVSWNINLKHVFLLCNNKKLKLFLVDFEFILYRFIKKKTICEICGKENEMFSQTFLKTNLTLFDIKSETISQ